MLALTGCVVGACTSILGNDFTVDEGAGGSSTTAAGGSGGTSTTTDGGGGAASDACSNMVRDESETDIDCGGVCPDRCALGRGCMLDSDCESDHCGDENVCVPPPPCGGGCQPWQTCVEEVCSPSAIVYVNLDGGTFSYGSNDDASLNIQQVSSEALPSNMSPYGGTEFDKAAIFDPIVASFEPFDITVTRTRPEAGTPYQMVVVTPSGSAFDPDQKIWAPPPDCGDQDDDNVAFVIFSSQSNADEGITPGQQATVVAQTIGLLMGLEPVNGVTDIMHHVIAGAQDRTFEALCHAKPTSSTWVCNANHMAGCNGNANLQSSFAELIGLHGARP